MKQEAGSETPLSRQQRTVQHPVAPAGHENCSDAHKLKVRSACLNCMDQIVGSGLLNPKHELRSIATARMYVARA